MIVLHWTIWEQKILENVYFQGFFVFDRTLSNCVLVELAKTDLEIYQLVFNEDILQLNLPYYHAYYHKKQDANSDDILPFRDGDYIIKICTCLRYFALKDLNKRI